jgi:hypothetical protein
VAVCEVLEEPGERKERWPYLRAALSSTIDSTAFLQLTMSILDISWTHEP